MFAFLAACAHVPPPSTPLSPWSEPVADYLERGAALHPEGFHRAITGLTPFGGQLWLGYGDATLNLGTPMPIELRAFSSPRDPVARAAPIAAEGGAAQRTPFDTGEEQIEPYRVLGDELWVAGVDSNDLDEAWTQQKPGKPIEGNVLVLRADGWHKYRAVPGGEHVHDVARFEGAVWAVGSGAANREEFDVGRVFRYLWRSDDGGRTFAVVRRDETPDPGRTDTRYRKLLVAGDTLYVFGYVHPFEDGGPLIGKSLTLRQGAFGEVAGPLGEVAIQRTFPLGPWGGLAVTRSDAETRTFLVREGEVRELSSWSSLRVLDVVAEADGSLSVLASEGGRTAIYAAPADGYEPLAPAVSLEVAGTALARWEGRLYVGTADGAVYRY